MKIKITEELFEILKQIKSQNYTDEQWAEIESSDMYQSEHFCGGYDSDEEAFCFSYYSSENKEFWFQFTLEDLESMLSKSIEEMDALKVN